MHEVCRALGITHNRVEHLSILRHEENMRRASVVPGKHGMESLMIVLKDAEIKSATKHLENKG